MAKKKKQPKWIEKLTPLLGGACSSHRRKALKWCEQFKSFKEAWWALGNVAWLRWLISTLDPAASRWECEKRSKAATNYERARRRLWDRNSSDKEMCELWRKYFPAPRLPAVKRRKK